MSKEQTNTSAMNPKRYETGAALLARLTAENASRVACRYCSLPILDMDRHVELCHEDGVVELHLYLAMLARPPVIPQEDMPTATHGFIFIDGVRISRMMQDHLVKLLEGPLRIGVTKAGQTQINNALLLRELIDHTGDQQMLTKRGRKFADLIAKLRGL